MITKYESAVKHAAMQAGLTGVQYVGYENPFNAKKILNIRVFGQLLLNLFFRIQQEVKYQ